MIVVSGYMAGDRAMVLADTYRLIEHYNGFLGKRAFVPYCELTSAYRYDGWLEVGQKRLNISFDGINFCYDRLFFLFHYQ